MRPYKVHFDETIIVNSEFKYMNQDPRLKLLKTDCIYYKRKPGFGATRGEIESERNSIIILPHRCQIDSKHLFHKEKDNTCRVYGDKQVILPKIKKYLLNNVNKRKKFLGTPEGLFKIIEAIKETFGNAYSDYFLLLDECHKLTTDSGYRTEISSCMPLFFKFKQKAFISATPLPPSHPGFSSFKNIQVVPENIQKVPLSLHLVNNLGKAFKDYIHENDRPNYCIFFNSINGILSLINTFGLKDDARVFCSEEGTAALKKQGVDASCIFTSCKRYNFFTSSFFNGIDLLMKENEPDVLILTDQTYADFTMVDPHVDTYQILGRFRNGFNKATHIANVKNPGKIVLETTALNRVKVSATRYKVIKELLEGTADPYLRDEVFGEALTRVFPYNNLLTRDQFDYFKFDNYLRQHRVRNCYSSRIALGLTYIFSDLYNLSETTSVYLLEDFEKLSRKIKKYSKDNVAEILDQLTELESNAGVEGYEEAYRKFYQRFEILVNARNRLGYKRMAELDYNFKEIQKKMVELDSDEKLNSFPFFDLLNLSFTLKVPYLGDKVKEILQSCYERLGIEKTAKASEIHQWFKCDAYFAPHKGVTARWYKLHERLYNSNPFYQRH